MNFSQCLTAACIPLYSAKTSCFVKMTLFCGSACDRFSVMQMEKQVLEQTLQSVLEQPLGSSSPTTSQQEPVKKEGKKACDETQVHRAETRSLLYVDSSVECIASSTHALNTKTRDT